MPFEQGHLATHPLPNGIVGALSLGGYQLLVDIAGVGAGRLGQHAFLIVAPEQESGVADASTQIALHQPKLRDEQEAMAFAQLAAQLGYLRLSGYRLAMERNGLRSKINVINPATGGIAVQIPDKQPGKLFGGGAGASSFLATVRGLPPAGPPPDTSNPELMRQAYLALALGDDSIGGAEAADLADKAFQLASGDPSLDPKKALEAAKQQG